jgi:hypothetical protein
MTSAGKNTRWLNAEEQRSWRAWVAAVLLLPDQLSRDLQRQHDLTLADYEILVWLSESPDLQLRMSDLANRTLSSDESACKPDSVLGCPRGDHPSATTVASGLVRSTCEH